MKALPMKNIIVPKRIILTKKTNNMNHVPLQEYENKLGYLMKRVFTEVIKHKDETYNNLLKIVVDHINIANSTEDFSVKSKNLKIAICLLSKYMVENI